MGIISALLIDLVRRLLIGFLPDLKDIVLFRFKTLVKRNVESPDGGVGKPDYPRFAGNLLGLVALGLFVVIAIGMLEHFGFLPPGTSTSIIQSLAEVLKESTND